LDIFLLFFRMVLVLALVLVLAYFSLRLGLPKLYPGSPSGTRLMTVVERLALAPKSWLYIVKVGEEFLLIGVDGGEITYLKELPEELGEKVDLSEPRVKDFKSLLNFRLKTEGESRADESINKQQEK